VIILKPIIGIITRKSVSEEGHNTNIVYNDIARAVVKNGGIPIGLILSDDYELLIDICDGIIFQGGDDFEEYDFKALKYIYDKDIPVLGICLGMQAMGVLFNGDMIDIDNHKKKLYYAHSIRIKKESKLYNIFKKEIIKVNSRHRSVIKNTNLDVVALSHDGYIEGVEDNSRKFFVGVQWHPESMIDYDEDQNSLFKSFIDYTKD